MVRGKASLVIKGTIRAIRNIEYGQRGWFHKAEYFHILLCGTLLFGFCKVEQQQSDSKCESICKIGLFAKLHYITCPSWSPT